MDANKGKGKVGGDAAAAPAAPAESDEKEAAPVNPLFAALNKGGAITANLKKVTRDMTNKDKKISGKIADSGPKKTAAPKKKAAPKNVKPPAIRKQGFRI